MSRTVLGLAVLALGIAIAIVSGIAHLIGLSFTAESTSTDSFGGMQVAGLVVGIGIAVAGGVMVANARGEHDSAG